MLADHLQSGGILHGHDDVPDTFKERLLEEERDWSETRRFTSQFPFSIPRLALDKFQSNLTPLY